MLDNSSEHSVLILLLLGTLCLVMVDDRGELMASAESSFSATHSFTLLSRSSLRLQIMVWTFFVTTADTEATISFKLLLVQCAGVSLAAVWATSFTDNQILL